MIRKPQPSFEAALKPVNCTAGNLRQAMRAVAQFYDGVIGRSGLTVSQFSLLSNLAQTGPMPIGALAKQMVIDRTTLTRNLKPLERAGFIETVPGTDRRARPVAVTEAGAAALAAARPLWAEAQRALVTRLGVEDWADLIGRLRQTIDVVR
jgi:DNA-binding MarR family transcriptional regulator